MTPWKFKRDNDMKRHTLLLLAMIAITTTDCFAQKSMLKIDTTANFVIHFRFDKSVVDSGYMNNASTLKSIDSLLSKDEIQSSPDSILVIASSSPDGNVDRNRQLARLRARNLKGYLIWKHPQIDQFSIKTESIEENWDGLRDLIVNDKSVPHRERAIEIIDSDVNPATKEWRLRQVGGGATWKYIESNVLRNLRFGASCVIFHKIVKAEEPKDSIEIVPEAEKEITEVVPDPETEPVVEEVEWIRKPLFAIKTNLLYDLGTVLNAELEVPIGRRWSVSAESMFPWWKSNRANWTMQLLSGHGAVKYWFGDRERRDVLTGWSLGLYGGGGTYDFQMFDKDGIQGDFFDAGLQLGFAHKIGKVLRMEYALGLGYMQSDYKKYDKAKDTKYGEIKVFRYPWETLRVNWIGPTSAKVSLVWLINYKTIKR